MRESLAPIALFVALMWLASFWVDVEPGARTMDYLMSLAAGAFAILILLVGGMFLLWLLLGLPGFGGILRNLLCRKD